MSIYSGYERILYGLCYQAGFPVEILAEHSFGDEQIINKSVQPQIKCKFRRPIKYT